MNNSQLTTQNSKLKSDSSTLEVQRGDYTISTDPARLDVDAIHGYLSRSYWAADRPKETTVKALQHSLNFGVYHGDAQVGLARVITDRATFAYLSDVHILEEHRGVGLGKWLISVVTAHPELKNIRQFLLITRDAHGLYKQYGFTPLEEPDKWMEIPYSPPA